MYGRLTDGVAGPKTRPYAVETTRILILEIVMMRRAMCVGLAALLLAATSLAQMVREMPHRRPPAANVTPLRGEQKLRYLVKQLELNADDREFAEGLIEVYRQAVQEQTAEGDASGDLVERVRTLYARMQEAEKAGKKEEAERLREQMKTLGPGVTPEREFFESLRAALSDEQNVALDQAIERLKNTPDGALRPIDILRVVRAQNLTTEQQTKLSQALREFRDAQQNAGRPSEEANQAALNSFIETMKAILTPEQAAQLDKRIEQMRPEPPSNDAEQEPDDANTSDQPTP